MSRLILKLDNGKEITFNNRKEAKEVLGHYRFDRLLSEKKITWEHWDNTSSTE